MEKFWMVLLNRTSHNPAIFTNSTHATLESAKQEAQRLLALRGNEGRGVTILEAVEQGEAVPQPLVWHMVWHRLSGDTSQIIMV